MRQSCYASVTPSGTAWQTRSPDVRRDQIHGPVLPPVQGESWGKSLLCAVLVAVVLVAMVAAWGAFA